MRNQGKTTVNLKFVRAYLRALDKAMQTGETVPIEGFSGWKVSSPKEDLK